MGNRVRESKIESYLKDQIKSIGGLHFKLKSTRNGVPDQMIMYEGVIYLIEVKRPGEVPNPQQRYVHGLINKQGIPVYITATIEDVDNFLQGVLKAIPIKTTSVDSTITIKSRNQFKVD